MPGSMGFTGGIVASNVPPAMSHVTFSQRLGEQLPLDAKFKDESGRDVVLGDYFGKKPVVLAFVYFQCPMLCPLVMNGISSALKVVPFTAGQGIRRRTDQLRSSRYARSGKCEEACAPPALGGAGNGRWLAFPYWYRAGNPACHVRRGIHLSVG